MTTIEPKKLFSLNETAKMLSISPRTVWNITYPRGELKSSKIGNRVLYSEKAIMVYIALLEKVSNN